MKDRIKVLTMTASGLERKEGISSIVFDLFSCFERERFQLDMIAFENDNDKLVEEFRSIGVNIRFLPNRKRKIVNYVRSFAKLLKRERYDAIYLHGSSAILSIELVLAAIYGVRKRVVHAHNTACEYRMADRILRPVFYRTYTAALACGEDAGKWLYGGRPFDVIRNGRKISAYQFDMGERRKIRRQLGVSEDMLLVGHVGNFNRQKNQRYLLGVLRELVRISRNVRLYFMGEGDARESVMKEADKEGLCDYTVFMGSTEKVPEMLQAMDVMLLPSLHEGLPLVVIEWQISGLPCIVSNQVTRECAYTDLVHFLPLDRPLEWAKTAVRIVNGDREESSGRLAIMTRKNGYDVEQSAEKLQSYFLGRI